MAETTERAAFADNAVDVLSDEVLQTLCMCLPGRDLLRFSATAKAVHRLTCDSSSIWRCLANALLGEPICHLQVALAEKAGRAIDTAFWQSLFRHGRELRVARWSSDLRSAFLDSLSGESEQEKKENICSVTVGSGHCTVGLGHLVVKVGGLRPSCNLDHMHTAVFDLQSLTARNLQLTSDSQLPERRLRHAACEIRPDLTSQRPAVLVLGGCHDRTKQPCRGGLQLLHILEILDDTGSLGRWHAIGATGQAPGSIWHHVCGSFALGKRVIVFGGDFQREDPEYESINNRAQPPGFVYVLDVDRSSWERVVTSGPGPTWRSLHAGFTHRDISSHSERLVILGGCAENLPIFSSSDRLVPMHGHALDLRSFEWLPQPADTGNLPPARLRLASEKMGEWLLLYGGHGDSREIGERTQLHKLNLRTLRWSTLEVQGREGSHPAAPAATMTAGLVLGGVRFGPFGISPVAKLDVLTLGSGAQDEQSAEGDQHDAEDEDEDEDDDIVAVVIRDGSGNSRRVALPRAMLALLAGVGARTRAGYGDDDAEQGEEDEREDRDNP